MKCESCDKDAVACTSEWLNDEAMKVLYWCAEHAPEGAESFNIIDVSPNAENAVYVTTMYRYGNRELHSYVLGVWSTRELAEIHGNNEAAWRGGKYEPEVTEWTIDANEYDEECEP